MIPSIEEVNFPPYATLHQATVSLNEMGERTISTQIRIDGDITPEFGVWEENENEELVFKPMKLIFRGEEFVLPTQKPQAAKDNTTRYSLVDLVFSSSPIHELKRYFFAQMAPIETNSNTIIIDNYVASLRLSLSNFVAAFNKVLNYYYNGSIIMSLNPYYQDSGDVKEMQIDYSYIWDVLTKMHEVYDVTWNFHTENDVTTIRVGYDSEVINDHIFQYGFDGGLLRFERHVEDTELYNVLLGRGGEKNLPYRYFKQTDEYNPIWSADPDAIPELRNVYFSRLLDGNFRNYVQGWKTNPHRDTTTWPGTEVETYDIVRAETDWAYAKGHNDTRFDPVEYVKDDDSIAIYGIRQGKLDDNDDIFPTIQGIWLGNLGRADEIVDVEIAPEGSEQAEDDIVVNLDGLQVSLNTEYDEDVYSDTIVSQSTFTVPNGRVGRLEYAWLSEDYATRYPRTGYIDTTNSHVYGVTGSGQTERLYDDFKLPAGGPYNYRLDIRIKKDEGIGRLDGIFGIKDVTLHMTPEQGISNRRVFTIWIKNIWNSTQNASENDVQFAHRVWDPILGDRIGNQASVMFSTGFMSSSEDYDFVIYKLPEVDRTRTITTVTKNGATVTVNSLWKITLIRSDAEYEATGLYIPNTSTGGVPIAGDKFFFTGIDMPFNYVKWAEERLTESKEEKLLEEAWTNATWNISLDKIRAHESEQYASSLASRLDAGTVVKITDPRFTPNKVLSLGIRTLTFTWNEPSNGSPYIVPDIDVVLSDKIDSTETLEDMKSDISYISQNYVKTSAVKKIKGSVTNVSFGGDITLGGIIGTVTD